MILSFHLIRTTIRVPFRLTAAAFLVAASLYLPNKLTAGTGGVEGGCAYTQIDANGKTTYEACVGTDLPMWYSTSQNPNYNEGDFPCGTYGNENCGVESGDPLNE